eukprot:scaffold872_cov421-Prasinococcus_capsulatus_cf.AAC.6
MHGPLASQRTASTLRTESLGRSAPRKQCLQATFGGGQRLPGRRLGAAGVGSPGRGPHLRESNPGWTTQDCPHSGPGRVEVRIRRI